MQLHDLERIFAYHSPQYPGFTCWVGLWNMPDDSVMCSFIQATGPAAGRPKAPEGVREYLTWPPTGHGDEYDMTGCDLRHVHLRSTDFARTWELVSADPFESCMNGAPGETEETIPDESATYGGVILRKRLAKHDTSKLPTQHYIRVIRFICCDFSTMQDRNAISMYWLRPEMSNYLPMFK